MPTYEIAVLPGDGVGPEVMAEAVKVLRVAETRFPELRLECTEHPAGARCYKQTGTDLPQETLEACRKADAILFGSAGLPHVRLPDGTGIAPQLTLRFILDLYAGVRPIKRYAGVPPTLAADPPIDYVIVRENTEGLYASWGGGIRLRDQAATDTMIMTRQGAERIARYAFHLAQKRHGAPADGSHRVTCVDKADVLRSMLFFRQVFDEVARDFPEIEPDHFNIDAMALYMVQRPSRFDVVVTENMFGDIISDLGAGTIGGMGLSPSADVGDTYALFQPSHGTAPDIAGKGIANPIAQILSAAMMVDWLGERKQDPQARAAARAIEGAVEITLGDSRFHTPDVGGRATTKAVGDAVAAQISGR
ncbi:MAG: isocitrate/isopropylmalate dehydrogenase family protein [Candidatus Methylomirabilia bacterium]